MRSLLALESRDVFEYGWTFWWLIASSLMLVLCFLLLRQLFTSRVDLPHKDDPYKKVLLSLFITLLLSLPAANPDWYKVDGNSVKGQYWGLTIALVGTGAVFFIVYTTLHRTIRTGSPDLVFESYKQAIEYTEKERRLVGYEVWITAIDKCRAVVEHDQWSFINEMLPKAYYHGPGEYRRLSEVSIHTYFFYTANTVYKIQRIDGKPSHDGPVHLYDPSSPSLATGKATSVIVTMNENKDDVEVRGGKAGTWIECNRQFAQAYILSKYDMDLLVQGDYLYLDLAKYVDGAAVADSDITLLVSCNKAILQPTIWEMHPSSLINRKPLPILFRRIPHNHGSGLKGNALKQYASRVNAHYTTVFEPVLQHLEAIVATPAMARYRDVTHPDFATLIAELVPPARTVRTNPYPPLFYSDKRGPGVVVVLFSY
jgi:hypothetical protein